MSAPTIDHWLDSVAGRPAGFFLGRHTRGKVVTSRWDERESRGADLGFPTST